MWIYHTAVRLHTANPQQRKGALPLKYGGRLLFVLHGIAAEAKQVLFVYECGEILVICTVNSDASGSIHFQNDFHMIVIDDEFFNVAGYEFLNLGNVFGRNVFSESSEKLSHGVLCDGGRLFWPVCSSSMRTSSSALSSSSPGSFCRRIPHPPLESQYSLCRFPG
ncbi:hypothetical protein G9U52_22170 [Paenibacillus sp. S3N08]|uniref:Uncharacterized protein n=2 Tax=Paenibacillus agricola TaxID=2716264 RepID=A0ABX0JAF4_9BACL|nr:hypothetical protein [Paenibacillus agricola]